MSIKNRYLKFLIAFSFPLNVFASSANITHFVESENAVFFDSTSENAKEVVFYFPKTYVEFQAFYNDEIIPNPDPDLFIARVRINSFIYREPSSLTRKWQGKILRPWNITPVEECILETKENALDIVQSIEEVNREISGASTAPICEFYFRIKNKDRKKILDEFKNPEKYGWNIKRFLILRLINERKEVKIIYL
ncbi:hypothetical protein [Fluviispira multicolorata]|uniref:Uncharacterized protein n=1 Tax=Fluviispira multicolorata TaxID=2654512 RepID=A0A833N8B4_9BACT|nr:hypothetical protein [Fluviispira multicolorata]KAB8033791.1 hypothetical protein GCL57_03525 [Fluviispira multicolorata]